MILGSAHYEIESARFLCILSNFMPAFQSSVIWLPTLNIMAASTGNAMRPLQPSNHSVLGNNNSSLFPQMLTV